MSEYRALFAQPQYRGFVRKLLTEGGVIVPHSPLDRDGATDPYELAAQKARRDFALQVVDLMGWSLDVVVPQAPAPRQAEAVSDPGGGAREQSDPN